MNLKKYCRRGGPASSRLGAAGFTIVELLVVVGLVMILIGLALPMLSRSREAARQSVCAQQIVQHMKVVELYAADNQDAFPFLWPRARAAPQVPGLPDEIPPFCPDWYGAVAGLWHLPMLEAYGDDAFNRSLLCPSGAAAALALRDELALKEGVDPSQIRGTLDYQMSMAMYLDPRALDPAAPSFEPKYYTGQRLSAVKSPSNKAAIFEGAPAHDPRYIEVQAVLFPNSRNVGVADGSVRFRSTADMISPVLPPQLVKPGGEALFSEANKGVFTPWGVAGRDW